MWSDSASVLIVMWRHKGDLNSALWKNSNEPSSSRISTEASFNDDSNKENINVNKVC